MKQLALITGPTAGIGIHLAHLFAEKGYDLFLVSRNATKLNQMKVDCEKNFGVSVHVYALDLSLPGSPETLLEVLQNSGHSVDVLVNNAGYGVYGAVVKTPLKPQLGMIQLHCTTPTVLAHALLPHMIKQNRGGILNIASTAAFQPVAIQNVYCASKTYLLHFTEALAEELRNATISITCFCPGPTETDFFDAEHMKHRGPAKSLRMDSKIVAEQALRAFERKQVIGIAGWKNAIAARLVSYLPRSTVRVAARKIIERVPDSSLK